MTTRDNNNNTLNVNVLNTLDRNIITYTLHNDICGKDIKELLRDSLGLRIDLMRLIHNGVELGNTERLADNMYNNDALLELEVIAKSPIPSNMYSYDEYIKSVTYVVKDMDNSPQMPCDKVCLRPSIRIKFGRSARSDILQKGQFVSFTDSSRALFQSGDMAYVCGMTNAIERGFVQWTSVLIDSHIILLKAKHGTIEEATSAIESSLYHRRNNKNYNEGDMHSWQRYTRNIPLQTKHLLIDSHEIGNVSSKPHKHKTHLGSHNSTQSTQKDHKTSIGHDVEATFTIEVTPITELEPNTVYVLLLVHGATIESQQMQGKGGRTPNRIIDDKIFCFRTSGLDSSLNMNLQTVSTVQSTGKTSAMSMTPPKKLKITMCHSIAGASSFGSAYTSPLHSPVIIPLLSLADENNISNLTSDAVRKAVSLRCGIPASLIHLIASDGTVLNPESAILSYDIGRDSNDCGSITAFCSFSCNYNISGGCYNPFIKNIIPQSDSTGVSIHTSIVVEFKSVTKPPLKGSLSLDLSCFVDKDHASTRVWNMDMCHVLGNDDAERRGFRAWDKSLICKSKLLLLESSGNDDRAVCEMYRYQFGSWGGDSGMNSINGNYFGGDGYSWQRYTNSKSVAGTYFVNSESQSITFKPNCPLLPGKLYIILLMHGVPTIASSNNSIQQSAFEDGSKYGIPGDLLSFFVTQTDLNDTEVEIQGENSEGCSVM